MSGDKYIYRRSRLKVEATPKVYGLPIRQKISDRESSFECGFWGTIHTMPEFKPPFFSDTYDNNKVFNAIIEIMALWEYVTKEALHNYSDMYSQLSIPLKNTVKDTCRKHKEGFSVYDRKKKTWLIDSNEPNYKYCYDGQDFEDFEVAKYNPGKCNRLLLVGKYTTLMQEPNLVRETKSALSLFSTFRMPSTILIIGVPGCGKTSYIVRNHKIRSLVLTSCAEAAGDIRSRMAKLRNSDASKFRDSYRTIDSYLLHNKRPYSEVWVDEALMEHPGKLFLVCLFSRCRVMFMLGDPNQLGYINRVNAIELRYDKTSIFFKNTQTLNISYRCPVDVMAILSHKYEGGAFSTSTIMRSLQCKAFTSLKDIPKKDETKYLVFKQAEKKEMKKAGYSNVSTVHEYQGKEAEHVVIVRMSSNLREQLYDSAAHVLVGMTRHRQSLVYYTPVTDSLKRLINTPLTDEELLKHQVLTTTTKPSLSSKADMDYGHQKPTESILISTADTDNVFIDLFKIIKETTIFVMKIFVRVWNWCTEEEATPSSRRILD